MGYANILVSVDLGEAARDRIQLAAGLARRFEATLTGAAAESVPAPVLVRDIQDAVRQEEENEARIRKAIDEAQAVFDDCIEDKIRTEWRSALAGPVTHLVEMARGADLVVVSRHGEDDLAPRLFDVPPGPLLMEAGRPVLVVPPDLPHVSGARVVVAWKDGPAARRAVAFALPFLRNAAHVHIATVGEHARREGGEDVAAHLTRHGAAVATHYLRSDKTEGDEVLRFASAQEADLIVMGAYGHSRLREWMFGGVTRHILRRSPVCCLMCH